MKRRCVERVYIRVVLICVLRQGYKDCWKACDWSGFETGLMMINAVQERFWLAAPWIDRDATQIISQPPLRVAKQFSLLPAKESYPRCPKHPVCPKHPTCPRYPSTREWEKACQRARANHCSNSEWLFFSTPIETVMYPLLEYNETLMQESPQALTEAPRSEGQVHRESFNTQNFGLATLPYY